MQVRGCSVFAGYFDNAAANSGIFSEDGWLRTGDLAVMSETGHVRITGRSKDIINRGGVKLNPSDVEALIDQPRGGAAKRNCPSAGSNPGRARVLLCCS